MTACQADAPQPPTPPPAPETLQSSQDDDTAADVTTRAIDPVDDDDAGLGEAVARAAWEVRRTSTGETVATNQGTQLERQVLPGSVFKVVTALAALEQRRADLGVVCPRQLTVRGRTLDCVHPVRAEPMDLGRALADSCNTYFVALGARLDRAAWHRTATRLGVPAGSGSAPAELLAIGLDAPRASARVWRDVVLRALTASDVPLAHRLVIRNGLRRAAAEGSARALADSWTDTLAKTGTVVEAGASEGIAVVLRPEEDLDAIVRVRGGAGRDAAAVAAAALARVNSDEMVVRVGFTESRPILRLDVESYVARVIAAEATPDLAPATLDALAIAVRTYAAAHRGRHASEGFDMCDTTHCQVLAPTAWPAARAAAGRTRTLVLGTAGQVMPVYYGAPCAGRLHSAASVWGGAVAVDGRVGLEPNTHPVPAWRSDVSAQQLSAALAAAGFRGDGLRGLRVHDSGGERAGEVGRPASVELEGLVPSSIAADRFRTIVGRALGWHLLKSHDWSVTRTAAGFRFEGRGKGHGVGLCLAGAQAMVAAAPPGTTAGAGGSVTASDILSTYYPTLTLQSTSDHVRLRASHASQARAPRLMTAVHRIAADLRRDLHVSAPRLMEVVEHPTIEAYQRATGRAWWTGGSTHVGPGTQARIDFPPLDVLERTGQLDARLRHELTHVLTDATLRDAPLWRREGLAVLQSGIFTPQELAGGAASCPGDEEVARPGDADAMQRAYRRAAGCVSRDLGRGDQWRFLAAP